MSKVQDPFIDKYGPKGDTNDPQKVHSIPTKGTQKTPMKIYKIRLHPEDYRSLKDHFEGKGIKVSQGIRLIISDFMKREGL